VLACGGVSAPSPLRGYGWDEGWVLRRPSWGVIFGVVARWLACGGLSDACRRPSYFSLLAQREVAKRNGLSSPPTLQALSVEGLGTDRTLPVRPTATPRRRRSLRAGRGCRGLPRFARSNTAEPLHPCSVLHSPHRHSGAGRNPVTSVCGRRETLPLPRLNPGLRPLLSGLRLAWKGFR
jgi:hypothetical protein